MVCAHGEGLRACSVQTCPCGPCSSRSPLAILSSPPPLLPCRSSTRARTRVLSVLDDEEQQHQQPAPCSPCNNVSQMGPVSSPRRFRRARQKVRWWLGGRKAENARSTDKLLRCIVPSSTATGAGGPCQSRAAMQCELAHAARTQAGPRPPPPPPPPCSHRDDTKPARCAVRCNREGAIRTRRECATNQRGKREERSISVVALVSSLAPVNGYARSV